MGEPAYNRVLIVGVGGLGVPAALALLRAGIRAIALVDPDPVELSNLPRQIIYRESDIGTPKVSAAANRLRARCVDAEIKTYQCELNPENAGGIISNHCFVIDATDNPAAKFLINDTCIVLGKPFIYAGVLGMTGQAMTVIPGRTACLRCLFEEPPDEAEIASCREAGIVGPVAGALGEIEAAEAVRWIRGEMPALAGAMLTYNSALLGRTRLARIAARPGCGCNAATNAVPAAPSTR